MPDASRPDILVFGGTGFIGRNFAAFASERRARITACGRSAPPKDEAGVRFVQADATDLAATRRMVREAAPDVILFGVSRMQPRAAHDADPAAALTELPALVNVMLAAGEAGVKHLVYCSSGGAIYGDGGEPHRETDLCHPKSLYGQLKMQAETLIGTLCPGLGIRAAVLRIGNPYGPHQSPFGLHGVIPVFTHRMLTGAPITVMGALDAAKDYIFIDDVSAAIWAAIERQAAATYNIGSGATTTLRTLIRKISEVCSVQPNIEYRDVAAAEVRSFALDTGKAQAELHWRPAVDLDTGIRATKTWIERNYPAGP